jgi:hypothetical protein
MTLALPVAASRHRRPNVTLERTVRRLSAVRGPVRSGTPIPSKAPATHGEEDCESQHDDADQRIPIPDGDHPPTAKKNATISRPAPPNRAAVSMGGEASPTRAAPLLLRMRRS